MVVQQELVNVLRKILVARLRDDVDYASDFASEHYEPDNSNGKYGLDTYQSYYSQLTKREASVRWVQGTDEVSYDDYHGWSFGLNMTDHISSHLHEAGHALFSPFNYAEGVAIRLKDERIHRIVNIIEDRRIEFLCDLWWHGAGIYDFHRADLIRQSEEAWRATGNAPVYTSTMSHDEAWKFGADISNDMHHQAAPAHLEWEARGISIAVMLVTYDLPGVVYDPVIMDVIDRFKAKILDAGCSIDKNAAIRVAVEIANYMDWRKEPPKNETPDNDMTGKGEPSQDGESSDNPNGDSEPSDSDEQNDESPKPSGDEQSSKPPESSDAEPQDASQTQASPPPEQTDGSDASSQPNNTKLDDELEQAMKQEAAHLTLRKDARLRSDIQTQKEQRPSVKHLDHRIEIGSLKYEPLTPDARMKAMLDSLHDVSVDARAVTSGVVTPRVWQMRHGNMKVFRQPPKRRGRTLVFVDMSGSMHCNCNDCKGPEGSTASKAWQVANAMAKAAGNAEIYGFGGGTPTGVAKIPVGFQPSCRHKPDQTGLRMNNLGSGTPICGALIYAERLIQSEASNSTLVFITDGGASNADGCQTNGMQCTRTQASRLAAAGADFIAVCMGTTAAFPASVTAILKAGGDTKDVGNLTKAIQHIRSRR